MRISDWSSDVCSSDLDTLWRLTNVETFDLTGPVQIGFDAHGTLANPIIRGSVMADDARLSSPVTGLSLTSVKIRCAFGGSTLELPSLIGTSEGGGKVTGSGSLGFFGRGMGIDLSLQADND